MSKEGIVKDYYMKCFICREQLQIKAKETKRFPVWLSSYCNQCGAQYSVRTQKGVDTFFEKIAIKKEIQLSINGEFKNE